LRWRPKRCGARKRRRSSTNRPFSRKSEGKDKRENKSLSVVVDVCLFFREKGEKQGLIAKEVAVAVAPKVEATEAVVQIRTAQGALTWKVRKERRVDDLVIDCDDCDDCDHVLLKIAGLRRWGFASCLHNVCSDVVCCRVFPTAVLPRWRTGCAARRAWPARDSPLARHIRDRSLKVNREGVF
jgi:hypothetical protein